MVLVIASMGRPNDSWTARTASTQTRSRATGRVPSSVSMTESKDVVLRVHMSECYLRTLSVRVA